MFDQYVYSEDNQLSNAIYAVNDQIEKLKESNSRNAKDQIKELEAINQTLREAFADKIRENKLKEKQRIAKMKADFIVRWQETHIKCGDRVTIEHDGNKNSFLIYRARKSYLENGKPKSIDVFCFGTYWDTGFIDRSSTNTRDLAKEIVDLLEPKQEIKLIDHYVSDKTEERNLASNLTFLNDWQTYVKYRYKPYGFDNNFTIKFLHNGEKEIKNFVITEEGGFYVAIEDYANRGWGYMRGNKLYANTPIELGEQIAKKYSYIDLSYKSKYL